MAIQLLQHVTVGFQKQSKEFVDVMVTRSSSMPSFLRLPPCHAGETNLPPPRQARHERHAGRSPNPEMESRTRCPTHCGKEQRIGMFLDGKMQVLVQTPIPPMVERRARTSSLFAST